MRSKSVIIFASLVIASSGFAADVTIGGIANQDSHAVRCYVFTTALIGYAFMCLNPGTVKLLYSKTTDGGATWGTAVDINAVGTVSGLDVWYDKWTPGDTGTLIHVWWFESTNSDVLYRTLDTNGDSLGTQRTVFNGASVVSGRGTFVSGTKTRSGYLYTAFDIDAGVEKGLYRSTDAGVNWASLSATFVAATIDECILFPSTGTGDNNDMWAIYQHASTDSLTMKMWDSSAVAEVESSSMQTMVENTVDATGQRGFAGSVRLSDGHIIVVSCSEYDTATGDMQAWDVSAVNAGSLTGISALTNITTDKDDIYNPAVYIDASNNIYVAYNGKRDGSETLGTSTKSYYTKSTDGGTTWSAGDTAYMQGSGTLVRQVWAPLSGPIFAAAWRDSTALTLNTNNINIVVGPSTQSGFLRLIGP